MRHTQAQTNRTTVALLVAATAIAASASFSLASPFGPTHGFTGSADPTSDVELDASVPSWHLPSGGPGATQAVDLALDASDSLFGFTPIEPNRVERHDGSYVHDPSEGPHMTPLPGPAAMTMVGLLALASIRRRRS